MIIWGPFFSREKSAKMFGQGVKSEGRIARDLVMCDCVLSGTACPGQAQSTHYQWKCRGLMECTGLPTPSENVLQCHWYQDTIFGRGCCDTYFLRSRANLGKQKPCLQTTLLERTLRNVVSPMNQKIGSYCNVECLLMNFEYMHLDWCWLWSRYGGESNRYCAADKRGNKSEFSTRKGASQKLYLYLDPNNTSAVADCSTASTLLERFPVPQSFSGKSCFLRTLRKPSQNISFKKVFVDLPPILGNYGITCCFL